MAFYSSSENMEESENACLFSARSNVSTLCSGRLSERTERSSLSTTRSNLSTLRSGSPQDDNRSRQGHRAMANGYVNRGAWVGKTVYDEDRHSMDYAMNATDAQSTHNSNIVPPLDLQSEDGYPTHREDYTFAYRKDVVPTDKKDPMVAYNSWLSAKRKVKTDEALRRKKIEEAKIRQQKERKAKAEGEYQKWLEKKATRNAATAAAMEQQARNKAAKARRAAPILPPSPPKAERGYDPEVKEACLIQWDRKKRLQEEQRRSLKRKAEENQRQQEEQRKLMSAQAWQKWAAGAAKKPKPVPLNQGFFTLRGTVSKIFVNPNEWQGIVPEENTK